MRLLIYLITILFCGQCFASTHFSTSAFTPPKGIVTLAGHSDIESSLVYPEANRLYGYEYTAVKSGTLETGYMYSSSADSANTQMVVYEDDGTLLDKSSELTETVVGWNEYTFSGGKTITAGLVYRICGWGDSGWRVSAEATGSTWYDQWKSYDPTAPRDPWGTEPGNANLANVGDVTIYIEGTES